MALSFGIDPAKPPEHFNHRVASLHALLGDELRDKGKLVEAMDRYRQAIALACVKKLWNDRQAKMKR